MLLYDSSLIGARQGIELMMKYFQIGQRARRLFKMRNIILLLICICCLLTSPQHGFGYDPPLGSLPLSLNGTTYSDYVEYTYSYYGTTVVQVYYGGTCGGVGYLANPIRYYVVGIEPHLGFCGEFQYYRNCDGNGACLDWNIQESGGFSYGPNYSYITSVHSSMDVLDANDLTTCGLNNINGCNVVIAADVARGGPPPTFKLPDTGQTICS